jgi:TetR/AcrR family transcriptional regulator, tetracycline repressor protein
METRAETRERLTRDKIVGAALAIMDAEGLEAVTMRRVGRALGVEAMSLYNHVEDKDALLDGVCELVMRGFSFPPREEDWTVEARALARSFRQVLRTHPNVITLFSEHKGRMLSFEAFRPIDAALSCLRRAGLSDHETAQAYRMFGGFIFGFVLMEVGQQFGKDLPAGMTPEQVAQMLPDELATTAALLPELANCDPDVDFEYGLDLMVRGLEARIAAGSSGNSNDG